MGDIAHSVDDTAKAEKTVVTDDANKDVVDEYEEDHLYGWFCFTPSWLQCLNKPVWFLVFMCFAALGESMVVNGLVAVSMSSLETRFGLSSSQVGAIPSTYELAGIPVMLFIGYYGAVVHKPRCISIGMFLLSLASLLYALPHFTTGLYEWTGSGAEDNLCQPGSNRTDDCEEDDGSSSLSDYLYVFISSAVLMACGAACVYLLGAPYIDDCLPSDMSAFYLGIFYSMASLGPALAYICGGALLSIYTDFHSVDMDDIPIEPGDPRWVGAWWIGFLFTWALCLVVVLPLSGFSKILPGTEEIRKQKMAANREAIKDSDDADVSPEPFRGSCKEVPGMFKDLFTNLMFIFTMLAPIGDSMIIVGFTVFGPKYVENQFSVSAGLAAGLFGLVTVPGAAGGTILGGWIVKRLNLTVEQCTKWYMGLCLGVLGCVCLFFIQCDNPPFAGVSVFEPEDLDFSLAIPETSSDLVYPCNEDCTCSQDMYEPVCGQTDIIFFSPCFAGCTGEMEDDHGDTIFYNCSCTALQNGTNGVATPGVCDASYCQLMPLFFVILFLAMLMMFSSGMVQLSILFRTVRGDSRPLAMSVGMVLGRLLGSFPAPVIFGASLDASCILWSQKCGETGSCLYYDNSLMAWLMMAVCLGCKLWNVTFAILMFITYRYQKKKKGLDSEEIILEKTIEKTAADDVSVGEDGDVLVTSGKSGDDACAKEGFTSMGFEIMDDPDLWEGSKADDSVSTHL